MQTPKHSWDLERAAAWLRKHAWGECGEARAPVLDGQNFAAASAAATGSVPEPGPGQAQEGPEPDEEIDIAGWPALVAPFYD